MWRVLTKKEEREFKQWARENHHYGEKISSVWHPVIRAECLLIDHEAVKNLASDYVED